MKKLLFLTFLIASISVSGQSFYAHKTNKAVVNCESIEHGHNIVYKAKTKKEYRQKRKAMELFTKGKRNSLKRKGARI